MKVSIIIPTYNSQEFIKSALDSVFSQSYQNIECIVVDGASTDNTLNIIKEYKETYKERFVFISEKDKGVFDALNKGIKNSTGDIIGWLGSDDFYENKNVVEDAVIKIKNNDLDICWGDLLYVDKDNTNKILRNWKSSEYKKGMFQKGWQMPHFASFVKRDIFNRFGYFNLEFRIAADYDFFLRILEKNTIKSAYINKVFLKMRAGGQSNRSIKNIIEGNKECFNAWKKNNLEVNIFKLFLPKPFNKIKQYLS